MKNYLAATLFFLAGIGQVQHTSAQCSPTLAADSLQYITNDPIAAIATRGNITYIGGNFTTIGIYSGHFIGLDTLTGKTVNRNTWPKVNGNVNKVISDGAGGWIIGGDFSKVGDSSRNYIAQINASGAVTSWKPGLNGNVNSLLLFNSKVYIAGGFTNVNGSARNHVAAVTFGTGTVTSWNPNSNDLVYELEAFNGRVYAGGKFTTIGSATRFLVAALDTFTGHATAWNAMCYGNSVSSIAFSGASVYVGGHITNLGGQSRSNLGAVDTGTGIATTWNPSPNGIVNKIMANSNTLYVGGAFTHIGGANRNALAEVAMLTDTATAFNPIAPAFPNSTANDILVNGNKMYVCGDFEDYYSDPRRVKQIDIAGNIVTPWESYADSNMNTMAMSNGVLYVGGYFRTAAAIPRKRLAAIDMGVDTVTNWNPRADNAVTAIAVTPGAVYVGGSFDNIGYSYHPRMAALDTALGDTVSGISISGASAPSWMIYHAGTLYLGGYYSTMCGVTRNSLSAINAATGALTPWNPNCSAGVTYPASIDKMVTDGTNIYLTGSFTSIGGTPVQQIAAVSLSSGALINWHPILDGSPLALAVSNGEIYIGGSFNYCNGVFTPKIAKLNLATGVTSGTWTPFPNGQVNFIQPQLNFLYTSGLFSAIHTIPVNGLGIIDTGINIPDAWNPTPASNAWPYASALNGISFYSNKMYVAGDITSMYGKDNIKNLAFFQVNTQPDLVHVSGADTVCAGTTTTFTVTSTAPGATFQWRVNGGNVGTGSNIYSYTPANGDLVYCIAHAAPGACFSPDSAVSNIKVMVVNPYVNISGPATACAGMPVSDTALSASASASYQWRVNGVSAGTGNIHSYVPANGDHITCTIHGAVGCPGSDSATSAAIVMSVNANLDVLTSVTPNNDTVCAGATVACIAHTGFSGLHYSWSVNGGAAGLDDSTFSYVPANGDIVKCNVVAPAGGCYLSNPDSSSVALFVTANTLPTITLTGDSIVCSGTTGAYHVAPSISGATYLWYLNNTSTGATSTAYYYTPANGDHVSCVYTLPLSGCYLAHYDTSNVIGVLVNPSVTPIINISTAATTICAGTSASFYSATPGMTGGTYQWSVNGVNVGTNAPLYMYSPANGDNVKCVITAPATGCFSTPNATSNILTLTIDPLTVPTISLSAPVGASVGQAVTVIATVTNAGSNYLITWYKNSVVFNTSTAPTTTYIKSAGTDNITAKVSSLSPGCYDTTMSTPVAVLETPVGITDVAAPNNIHIYPNPFIGEITVKGISETDKVSVIDFTGREMSITVSRSSSTEQTISVKDIAAGSYFLRVVDTNGNVIAKSIVSKL